VMTPSDENECRKMLSTAFLHDGPAAVRYPRGAGAGVAVERGLDPLPAGRGEMRRHSRAASGARIAVLAFGPLLYPALRAAEALDASVVNMRFVKPLDTELLAQVARSHDALVSVEENVVMGGAGSACSEALNALGIERPFLHLGLPDQFIDHGDPVRLMSMAGLDAAGIERSVRERFGALLRDTRRVKSIA
jgi:1-deoxy-D-xylulose-5-phosphate synthase